MTSANIPPGVSRGEWWQATDGELAQAFVDTQRQLNRLAAKQAGIAAAISARGVFATYGHATVAVMAQRELRLTPVEGKKLAARAAALHASVEGTREKPAVAPRTAEAFADGAINAAQVDVIGAVMAAIPAAVTEEAKAVAEKEMIELARTSSAVAVKKLGDYILKHRDDDGPEPRDDEPVQPARELRWSWGSDHKLRINGVLDTETGQRLESLLSPLAKPQPAVDGTRDPRGAAERRADAFAELLEYTERAVESGTEAGETPAVMVSMTLDQLRGDNTGQALINWESPITAEQARRMECDARIIPVVLGGDGEILDLGRERRTATRAQRRALARRDGGCVGCGRTPRWCEVHHILEWIKDNGLTDLDNLVFLCGACHRLIHHSEWEVRMGADRRPELIPPAWIDPNAA